MKKVLFFGDSITDFGRDRNNDDSLGDGYPLLIKAKLGFDNPGKYMFVNRGISGDRIVDLYARIKKDLINHAPDYVSILIGVNGVLHEISEKNGVSSEKYELFYDMIISEIKSNLPNTKIIIMEPFVLHGIHTENTENKPNRWETFKSDMTIRAEIARKIAEKYDLPFVELQNKFDKASENIGPSYWLYDGVHPTPMGHELIKCEWIKTFTDLTGEKEK